jgi:hypothetical protein
LVVSLLVVGTLPAADLIPTAQISITTDPVTFESCPLRVRELLDADFQERYLNDQGHAIGTKLEGWADRIGSKTKLTWQSAILGESVWEPLGETPALGALPHLSDAAKGHWECATPTDTIYYTLKDYRRYNGLCPTHNTALIYRGVLPLQFQSGTGTRHDLEVFGFVSVSGS